MTSTSTNIIGLVLAAAAFKIVKHLQRLRVKARLIDIIRNLPEMTVEEIKKSVQTSGKAWDVLVRGKLDADAKEYVTSRIQPTLKLLYLKLTNKKFEYGGSRQVYESPVLEMVSSLMTLAGKTQETISVLDPMKTNFKAAIESSHKQSDIQPSLLSPFFKLLAHLRDSNVLDGLTEDYSGSIYEQQFIKPGNEKVVYGTFQPQGKSIVAKGFKYIAKSRRALVRMLQSELRFSKMLGYGGLLLLIAAVAWFAYRVTIELTAYFQKRRTEFLSQLKKLVVDKYSCKVCSKNIRCMILEPCTHLACCKDCFPSLMGLCPVCDKAFTESLELFVC